MLSIAHSADRPRPTLAQLRYRADEAEFLDHDEHARAVALIEARQDRPRTARPSFLRVVQ